MVLREEQWDVFWAALGQLGLCPSVLGLSVMRIRMRKQQHQLHPIPAQICVWNGQQTSLATAVKAGEGDGSPHCRNSEVWLCPTKVWRGAIRTRLLFSKEFLGSQRHEAISWGGEGTPLLFSLWGFHCVCGALWVDHCAFPFSLGFALM